MKTMIENVTKTTLRLIGHLNRFCRVFGKYVRAGMIRKKQKLSKGHLRGDPDFTS